jgi:hypothetical protein
MTQKDITDAWAKIRKIDNTIPDDVLNFMKDSAIEKLQFGSFGISNNFPPNSVHPFTYFATIKDVVGISEWWYYKRVGQQFTVKQCTFKGQITEMEGVGGYDVTDFWIVDNGEFMGNAILKKHCE